MTLPAHRGRRRHLAGVAVLVPLVAVGSALAAPAGTPVAEGRLVSVGHQSVDLPVIRGNFGDFAGNPMRQYLVSVDGTVRTLPRHSRNLVWSPAGRWLAYSNGRRLTVARADGSAPRTVARGGVQRFAWSPDGRFLAFSHPAGRITLLRIGPSGRRSGAVRLSVPPLRGTPPSSFVWAGPRALYVSGHVRGAHVVVHRPLNGRGSRVVLRSGVSSLGLEDALRDRTLLFRTDGLVRLRRPGGGIVRIGGDRSLVTPAILLSRGSVLTVPRLQHAEFATGGLLVRRDLRPPAITPLVKAVDAIAVTRSASGGDVVAVSRRLPIGDGEGLVLGILDPQSGQVTDVAVKGDPLDVPTVAHRAYFTPSPDGRTIAVETPFRHGG